MRQLKRLTVITVVVFFFFSWQKISERDGLNVSYPYRKQFKGYINKWKHTQGVYKLYQIFLEDVCNLSIFSNSLAIIAIIFLIYFLILNFASFNPVSLFILICKEFSLYQ